MKIIDFYTIKKLGIRPEDCVRWVYHAFMLKSRCDLPPKISQKLSGNVFINTMPCIIPELDVGGVKIVSRYPVRTPALASQILVYRLSTGEILAIMDGDWITAMRTGAVAALAIRTLAKKGYNSIGIIGLGNTARATLQCLTAIEKRFLNINLKRYKKQAQCFIDEFSGLSNVAFHIVDSDEELIAGSDVVISCVTAAESIIGQNEWFKPGVLVVPVHTRGFQNCDLFFDRVFADDTDHVKSFKYFDKFRYFKELSAVLSADDPGRRLDGERILSYNIGLALHDVYFAEKILSMLQGDGNSIDMKQPVEKFWV